MPEKQTICVDENFKLEEQFILRVPEVRKQQYIFVGWQNNNFNSISGSRFRTPGSHPGREHEP